jgi:hypothetical protein
LQCRPDRQCSRSGGSIHHVRRDTRRNLGQPQTD